MILLEGWEESLELANHIGEVGGGKGKGGGGLKEANYIWGGVSVCVCWGRGPKEGFGWLKKGKLYGNVC